MDLSLRKETIIGGTRLEPGAEWRVLLEELQIRAKVRCVNVHPEAFVGELSVGGKPVLTTDAYASDGRAKAALRELLAQRLQALLQA